jgi:rhodanese-related sulfurtransferase
MKSALIQLGWIVGVAVIVGLVYNLASSSTDNHLGLTVPEGRYRNALNCPKPSTVAAEVPPAVSGSQDPDPAKEQQKPPATDPAGEPSKTSPDPATSNPGQPAPSEPEVSNPGETEAPGKTPRILVDQAFEEWEAGTLFIDARRMKEYVKGHIPGAISISPWEKGREEKVGQLAETEPQEAPVVVYCTRSKDCEDSEEISSNLRQVGFENILVFQGGFPVWQEKEKPVVQGEDPGERPGQ